jgi:hypothetical protein
MVLEESGGLTLAFFLDPAGVFTPLSPLLFPVRPVLSVRGMLAWADGDEPVKPRGRLE